MMSAALANWISLAHSLAHLKKERVRLTRALAVLSEALFSVRYCSAEAHLVVTALLRLDLAWYFRVSTA